MEGGWKGLGSSTCFLQAAYRAPFSLQHAGSSYLLSILALHTPPFSLTPPRLFLCLALPADFNIQRLSLRPWISRAEADKSMQAFNLTQPRERTTKLEKSRDARKKWISFAPIPFCSSFCDPRTVVPSPVLSRSTTTVSASFQWLPLSIGVLRRRRETWKFFFSFFF